MIIQPLASGSKGNLTLIQSENAKILVDQGLSAKQAEFRLQDAGHNPNDIQAIFITHEHGDHIGGVRVFAKKYKIPVYINSNILPIVRMKKNFDEIKDVRTFNPSDDIEFMDLILHPFCVSHDAIDTVNFIIKNKDKSVGIFTDLGFVNNLVKMKAQSIDLMIL
jgi:phosphoribosyl 1,2-cyclic phosphodiesterase